MNLNLIALMENKVSRDHRVEIAIPTPTGKGKSTMLQGLLTSEISFSGSAQYDGRSIAGSDTFTSLLGSGTSIYNLLSDWWGKQESSRLSNKKAGGGATTVIQWTDSGYFSFSVEFVVIATKPEHNVTAIVAPLWDALYPADVPDGLLGVINAPMGYATSPQSMKATNTISVWVGDWFTCNSLVMIDGSVSYSKEIVHNGTPLFAAVSCTFQATRMLSSKDVQGYFKRPVIVGGL